MATTITLYKTQLSPYDIDRPNDMATYLSTCDSETVQSNRDMRFENLQEIEIMTSAVSSFDLMDCNYLEIVNEQISSKKWRYFVIGAAYSKANVATLSLKVDPWGCVCDWANGELYIFPQSRVLRVPKVWVNSGQPAVDLAIGTEGNTVGAVIHYRAGGTAQTNSFDGRGIPVVFAEVTDSLAATAKTYRVAFISSTSGGSYYNSSLNAQFQFLIDGIKDINVNGHYSMTISLSSGGSVTLNNVMVKQITGAYIVPSYAMAGLYGAEFWGYFENLNDVLYYDPDPINRAYTQIIGERRIPADYTSGRIAIDCAPLYVGNAREAIRVKRSEDYNGAKLCWSMGADGFTLTVCEICDTLEVHDLTNAITVPNIITSFFNVTTTTETEKTLNRVSSGVAVLGGVAAVAGGIVTENPVAVVAGAGTIARAASGAIEQEKRYKGEGANGFTGHGSGVNFSQYHKIMTSVGGLDTPPREYTQAIPIITAFTIYTGVSMEKSNYYLSAGIPVGDKSVPISMVYSNTSDVPLNLFTVRHINTSVGVLFNTWLFETVSIKVTDGIGVFIRELTDMLTTSGVRVWDTSTVTLSGRFKV